MQYAYAMNAENQKQNEKYFEIFEMIYFRFISLQYVFPSI